MVEPLRDLPHDLLEEAQVHAPVVPEAEVEEVGDEGRSDLGVYTRDQLI